MQLKEDVILIEKNEETKTFTVTSKRTDELTAQDFDGVIKQLEGNIAQIQNQLQNMDKEYESRKNEMIANRDLFSKRLETFKTEQSMASLWIKAEELKNQRVSKQDNSVPTPEEVLGTKDFDKVPETRDIPRVQEANLTQGLTQNPDGTFTGSVTTQTP